MRGTFDKILPHKSSNENYKLILGYLANKWFNSRKIILDYSFGANAMNYNYNNLYSQYYNNLVRDGMRIEITW